MKRRGGIVAFIMALAAGFHTAGAQMISAELDNYSIAVGSVAVLRINMSASALSGVQFDIIYDANVLKYEDSSLTELFDDALVAGINNDTPGRVSALAAFTEETEISGDVCVISFLVIGTDGSKSIGVENIKLMINGERTSDKDFKVSFSTKGRGKSGGNGMSHGSGGTSFEGSAVDGSEDKKDEDTQPEQTSQPVSATPKYDFSDIKGHWAEDKIRLMLDEGILTGMGDNSFAPDKAVTRAEFAVIAAKALNLEDIAENTYSDLSEGAWYTEAALKCCAASVMVGNDGVFRPDAPVTREEMAVILSKSYNYIGIENKAERDMEFTDAEEISDWAKIYVKDMANAAIISGYDDGSFRPKENTTRAHAASAISNLLQSQWEKL